MKESTNITSLKFQVSDECKERVELHKLKEAKSFFNFEIIYLEDNKSVKKVCFSEFKVTRLELRSYAWTLNKENSNYWRYFIEGKATDVTEII